MFWLHLPRHLPGVFRASWIRAACESVWIFIRESVWVFLSLVALLSLHVLNVGVWTTRWRKKEQLCIRITFYTIAYFVFFLFCCFEDLILDLESSSSLESIAFVVRGRELLRFLLRSIILTAVLYRDRSYFWLNQMSLNCNMTNHAEGILRCIIGHVRLAFSRDRPSYLAVEVLSSCFILCK